MILDNRKAQLLEYLIREHIKTALPVGSGILVDKYDLGFSSATIRNDLVELEKEELIFQPHTSAGRIPTEKGFSYFVDNFLQEKELEEEKIKKIKESTDIKNLAKILSQISSETILVAFNKNDFYYTGISNLFKKPEFKDEEAIINISDVIDKLDEIIPKIYNDATEDPKILLGEKNPFGSECASILMKKNNILIGILGLVRMSYEENLALMKLVKNYV